MPIRLSIFNFENKNDNRSALRTAGVLALLVLSVFLLDRVVFEIFFAVYDREYQLMTMQDPNRDVMLIGTSHFMEAINRSRLEQALGAHPAYFMVQSSGVTPRRYAFDYWVSQAKAPKVVVLEISKWLLDSDHYYRENVSVPLMPYYSKGVMKPYLDRFGPEKELFEMKRWIRTLTLNFNFTIVTEPRRVLATLIDSIGSKDLFERLKRRLSNAQLAEEPFFSNDRNRPGFFNKKRDLTRFDQALLTEVRMFLETAHRLGIVVVVVEMPFFEPDPKVDDFAEARKRWMAMLSSRDVYLRPDVPKEASYFNDWTHLNSRGASLVTAQMGAVIQKVRQVTISD